MKLVLQCAMCGTLHPVGVPACSACRAAGVPQLRLMFECQSCGLLDLNPVCGTCPPTATERVYELDDDLIVAEEVPDEFVLELDAIDPIGELRLELEDVEDESFVVDLSEGDAELLAPEDFTVELEYDGDGPEFDGDEP